MHGWNPDPSHIYMVPSLYVGFEYASLKVTAVGTEIFIKHQISGLGIS
jgi:hypothetical protein